MKAVLNYVRPHVPLLGIQFFIKFTGTVLELFLPWMLSVILDDAAPARDMSKVYLWGGAMILCALLSLATNVIANRMAMKVSRDVVPRCAMISMTRSFIYPKARLTG